MDTELMKIWTLMEAVMVIAMMKPLKPSTFRPIRRTKVMLLTSLPGEALAVNPETRSRGSASHLSLRERNIVLPPGKHMRRDQEGRKSTTDQPLDQLAKSTITVRTRILKRPYLPLVRTPAVSWSCLACITVVSVSFADVVSVLCHQINWSDIYINATHVPPALAVWLITNS
jgi:hypothetical protein